MPNTNILRRSKRSFNIFSKTTLLHKVLYFLAFLISMSLIFNYGKKQVEGFEEPKTNEFKTNHDVPNIYNDFYASIYDDLVLGFRKGRVQGFCTRQCALCNIRYAIYPEVNLTPTLS